VVAFDGICLYDAVRSGKFCIAIYIAIQEKAKKPAGAKAPLLV